MELQYPGTFSLSSFSHSLPSIIALTRRVSINEKKLIGKDNTDELQILYVLRIPFQKQK